MASHPDCARAATPAKAKFRPPASKLPPSRWLITLLVAGYCASVSPGDRRASAQTRKAAATLVVLSQLQLKPGQEAPLEIKVAPGDVIPPRSVIVIRGMPQGVKLNGGSPFGPGVWVVPAAQLTSVRLQVPPDIRVGGVLTLALTTLEGTALAEAHVTLLAAQAGQETVLNSAAAPVAAYDAPDTATRADLKGGDTPPHLAPERRAEMLMLLDKGRESFQLGNILHARQFYLRAAENGLAEAAFALAATYDPVELSRMKTVVGVTPDADLAMKWYDKARQLGSPDAAARLTALARP
jgi:hypothetical protein